MTTTQDADLDYGQVMHVLNHLHVLLQDARNLRGLSIRRAAAEMGMPFATLRHLEAGEDCKTSTVAIALRWLEQQ